LGKEIKVAKIKTNLSELAALSLESKLIDVFGLLPNRGYLTNLDEGVRPQERRNLYKTAFQTLRSMNNIYSFDPDRSQISAKSQQTGCADSRADSTPPPIPSLQLAGVN